MKKPMRLIGLDAIYIPQNWKNPGFTDETHIVPHQASQCTMELNFLYDNIIAAMS